jgi:hypothetical protein
MDNITLVLAIVVVAFNLFAVTFLNIALVRMRKNIEKMAKVQKNYGPIHDEYFIVVRIIDRNYLTPTGTFSNSLKDAHQFGSREAAARAAQNTGFTEIVFSD